MDQRVVQVQGFRGARRSFEQQQKAGHDVLMTCDTLRSASKACVPTKQTCSTQMMRTRATTKQLAVRGCCRELKEERRETVRTQTAECSVAQSTFAQPAMWE